VLGFQSRSFDWMVGSPLSAALRLAPLPAESGRSAAVWPRRFAIHTYKICDVIAYFATSQLVVLALVSEWCREARIVPFCSDACATAFNARSNARALTGAKLTPRRAIGGGSRGGVRVREPL
jgi:hypothetical protein